MANRRPLAQLLQEIRSAPLIDVPIGVSLFDVAGHLYYCNREARALLALPEELPKDVCLADLYADPQDFARLVEATDAGRQRSKALTHLRVKGRDLYVEHYLSPVPYEDEQGHGLYVSCIVDVTEDHVAAQRSEALQNTVREMTFDIGQILHANTSTLVMVNQTLGAAARALGPGLVGDDDASHPDELDRVMEEKAEQLVAAMARLLEAGDPGRRAEALPPERWEKLASLLPTLESYRENISVPELRVPALRSATVEILSACRSLRPGHMPKEVIRNAIRAAESLESLTCYMDIQATRTAVIQMDTSLASLRDFITHEIRTDDPSARFTAASIVREAISHLGEFARAARVDVVWRHRPEDVAVHGNRRDILRAVTNVLHNAIKYSWKREGHDAPWIAIDISEDDERDLVTIEIENWGVPVEQVEIEAGLIFNMGYRGKRSKDRGRLGTGIGLTDSKRVAESHGGTLEVVSTPARVSSPSPEHREYYRQPFITKVRFTLPQA